jgi:hyaluronan synthase
LISRFALALYYKDDHDTEYKDSEYPKITFIIACKNEEDSIEATIDTCLESEYPGKMDCIAVNDGSTDKTYKRMLVSKKKYKGLLKVINFKINKGKREAMRDGTLAASGEIIIFIDSDSFVEKGAVKHLVEHFMEDEKVGAVSGNTLVENVNSNILTKMQSARYGISFDIFKAAESVFGTVTCCPGCFSAYRKDAVLNVLDRWFEQKFLGVKSTYGDDRSLTNFILRKWKVVYCRTAKATTIVPDKFKKFYFQQLRWKKSWIKEGIFNTGSFIWKKNIIASISFYINLIIPMFGPIVVLNVIYQTIYYHSSPLVFVFGIIVMSILFGIYYNLIFPNKYWGYVAVFTVIYAFVLIWQMPYAFFRLRDVRWGTR